MEHNNMSLAFNVNGEPFEIPATATGWRVRRMKSGKGAPEVVYGRNGQPLVLAIDAGIEDLRVETSAPGRYRFDPVDDNNKPIADAPVGYAFLHEQASVHVEDPTPARVQSDNVVIEAMRMNADIAKSVVERFPQMVEAAASLLRAADGAGLPKREPRVVVEDDDDGDDDDDEEEQEEQHEQHEEKPAAPAFDLNAIVAQLVPLIVTSLMSGKLKIPGLGEMFDWRKASANGKAKTKAAKPAQPAQPQPPVHETSDDGEPTSVEPMIPPLDPETMAHFMSIQSALKGDEAKMAQAIASELSPTELRAWFEDLKKLTVPEAVARIRGLVGKKDDAS